MTLVFMSLLSLVIDVWIDERLGRTLLVPSLLFGGASILWWQTTGDLRPYGVAQFGPVLILLPALLLAGTVRGLWPVLLLYAAAKLAEQYDAKIFNWALLSGHTWKHFLAALATYFILRWRTALPLGGAVT